MCVYIISKYQKDQSCLVDATQEDKLSNITTKMIVACLNYTEQWWIHSKDAAKVSECCQECHQNEEVRSKKALRLLKIDLINGPHHCFGDHIVALTFALVRGRGNLEYRHRRGRGWHPHQ